MSPEGEGGVGRRGVLLELRQQQREMFETELFRRAWFKFEPHLLASWVSLVARSVKNPLANAGDAGDMGPVPGL